MKKIITYTSRAALTLLLFMAGINQMSGRTVEYSSINVNGTWYYAGSSMGWCDGGAFNGANIGTITSSLTIGGQSQVNDNGNDWGKGTMTMGYKIDGGTDHTITLTYYKFEYSKNVLQSGGASFTSETIDISNLSAGEHTISVWFVSEGVYDSNGGYNYNAKFTIPDNQSVTVGSDGYATYVSPFRLDYTSSAIKAYTAKVNTSTGEVVLSQINKVQGGVPVILHCAGGNTEDIPVATAIDTPVASDLVAGTGSTVPTTDGAGNYNYILNNSKGIGFYKANDQTVATNRAYLHTTYNVAGTPTSRMTIVFADETTGINNITPAFNDGAVYDLQGRRVAQPAKGLYIINGKKVIK